MAADPKLRWLLVGLGDIATKRVLPAIRSEPRSILAGIVTRTPQKAEPYGVLGWATLEEALAAERVDVVYIATPVFLHAPQSIACLQAGKHVLCEKPAAMNYAEASSMRQAAVDTGKLLGIAYYRRMYPKVNRAKALIETGAIGTPVFAEATSHDWFSPASGPRGWLVDPKLAGGGPLYDIASHRIDLMNYLFGVPQRATGLHSTLVHPIDVEDNATVLIDHATGVRSMIDVRWHSRVSRDEFKIRGTDGEMDLNPLNGAELVYPGGREDIPAPQNLHYPCIHEFASAVLDGTAFCSSVDSAIWTDLVTEQVVQNSLNCRLTAAR